MRFVHYLAGGGLGDVFREAYYHNALGILKRWKAQNPTAHLTLLLMSHNPSSGDFFVGQDWLDAVKLLRFPLETTWDWQACYTVYAEEFEGCTELRFSIPERRSLYRSDMDLLRPRRSTVQVIPAVGMAWWPELDASEQTFFQPHVARPVLHPYAGQARRCLPDAFLNWLGALGLPLDTLGAEYVRPEHAREGGFTVRPRILVELIRRAPCVIGTESSVAYIASMLGKPTLMLYPEGTALDLFLNHRDKTWDWYFNLNDPRSRCIRFDQLEACQPEIHEWLLTYARPWLQSPPAVSVVDVTRR